MSELFALLSLLVIGVPLAMYFSAARVAKLAGFALKDPLAWLIARDPRKARVLAGAGTVLSLGILILVGTWLARVPWSLDARSPVAISQGGLCNQSGARYTIAVNDSTFLCGGGDTKCPRGEVAVAYADRNPNRCRVRSNVDRLSLYELRAILLATAWLAFAAAVAKWQGVQGQAYERQSFGYVVFSALLVGLLAAMLLSPLLYAAWS